MAGYASATVLAAETPIRREDDKRQMGGTTIMPKYTRNAGKLWTSVEVTKLKQLAAKNTPTRVIGLLLGRPVNGVRAKASEAGISLKPVNQSPYNR